MSRKTYFFSTSSIAMVLGAALAALLAPSQSLAASSTIFDAMFDRAGQEVRSAFIEAVLDSAIEIVDYDLKQDNGAVTGSAINADKTKIYVQRALAWRADYEVSEGSIARCAAKGVGAGCISSRPLL